MRGNVSHTWRARTANAAAQRNTAPIKATALRGREVIAGLPSSVEWLFCYDSSMKRQRSWVLIPLLGGLFGCAPASPPGSAAAGAGGEGAGGGGGGGGSGGG